MKILRIRRGFTTNSSSASEYLPPQNTGETAAETAFWTKSNTPPLATGSKSESMTPPMPYGFSANSTIPAPGPALTGLPTVPVKPPSHAWSNAVQLGGVAALVTLAFVIDRVIRRILEKKRPPANEG